MKHYFAKHPTGAITHSSLPIQETGAVSYEFEVSTADMADVMEGVKEVDIKGEKLEIKVSNKKAEREAAMAAEKAKEVQKKSDLLAFKGKLEKGEATLAEIQEALNKLL